MEPRLGQSPGHPGTSGGGASVILVGALAFLQWAPPGLYGVVTALGWQAYLLISVLAFLWIGGHWALDGVKFYLTVSLLYWFGGLLSLGRAEDFDIVEYRVVSLVAPLVSGLLLLPALSTGKGRAAWLCGLAGAAALWAIEVRSIWLNSGEGIRLMLAGKETDKNFIALVLACGAVASWTLATYGQDLRTGRTRTRLAQAAGAATAAVLAYSVFLTYSRSGFLVTAAGFLFVTLSQLLLGRWAGGLSTLSALLALTVGLLAVVEETNPVWLSKFEEIESIGEQGTSIYGRSVLAGQAWSMVLENPLIGVGPEAFKRSRDPESGLALERVPHNTYLGAWVECGLLGILSYVVWIIGWLRIVSSNWASRSLLERMVLMTFVPFFLMLFFLDVRGPVHLLMLVILSGFAADRNVQTR